MLSGNWITVRRLALALLLLLTVVAVIVAMRTIAAGRQTPRAELAYAVPAVDLAAAASHLGAAIRFETIALDDQPRASAALTAFHAWLAATYPRFHATALLTTIADGTLVYEWQGSAADLQPAVLMAHQDVVPVAPTDTWTYPPFSGAIADGAVWGRGSIDNKSSLVALMEAAESLLRRAHRHLAGSLGSGLD